METRFLKRFDSPSQRMFIRGSITYWKFDHLVCQMPGDLIQEKQCTTYQLWNRAIVKNHMRTEESKYLMRLSSVCCQGCRQRWPTGVLIGRENQTFTRSSLNENKLWLVFDFPLTSPVPRKVHLNDTNLAFAQRTILRLYQLFSKELHFDIDRCILPPRIRGNKVRIEVESSTIWNIEDNLPATYKAMQVVHARKVCLCQIICSRVTAHAKQSWYTSERNNFTIRLLPGLKWSA